MEGYIDLKKLNLEELAGVVNIYPWFSLARKELCQRMTSLGGWGLSQYAEAAMYMSDRKVLSVLMRGISSVDCSDKDVSAVIDSCVRSAEAAPAQPVEAVPAEAEPQRPRPRFAGADYFSLDEYAKVREQGDASIIDYKAQVSESAQRKLLEAQSQDADVCTETLARIYLEQGYPDEAKAIYSKLILIYPEKSAYFATLIRKIEEIKN